MKGKTGKKNLVPVVKKCERCGNDFLASSNYVHFCSECSVIVKKERQQRAYKKNGNLSKISLILSIISIAVACLFAAIPIFLS